MQPFTWGSETSWDMADTVSGDLTHFTLTPTTRVGCAESVSGKLFDLHITKQNPQDYWQAGLPGADIHWVMQQNANGDFQAVASLVTWADGVKSGIPHTIDYIWDAYNYRGLRQVIHTWCCQETTPSQLRATAAPCGGHPIN